jgi:hypothetical protein
MLFNKSANADISALNLPKSSLDAYSGLASACGASSTGASSASSTSSDTSSDDTDSVGSASN